MSRSMAAVNHNPLQLTQMTSRFRINTINKKVSLSQTTWK
jgi:hypothetical protein